MSGFLFCFVVHPALDLVCGKTEALASTEGRYKNLFSFLLWIYLPIQIFFLTLILYWVKVRTYSYIELTGIILTTGAITGGLGITIAHELVHRKARWERGIGVALLALVNYSHFRVEHVFGHHKHVSTPQDPASARKGETIYAFLPRSIFYSLLSAWKIEAKRKSFFRNRLVHYSILAISLALGVYYFSGQTGLYVYLGQSFVAILTLEAINYIEHYGLERKEIRPGVYEPVTELHSWDSHYRMTNWFLFNLGRHAHHHSSPNVPYQELKTSLTENTLRFGYSTEILLAFIGKNTKR